MPRFLYLYRGPATPLSSLSPEDAADRMAAFGAWMEQAGPALVDVGSPFAGGASIRDDGLEGPAGEVSGYSFVDAADLDAARALTDGLPFLFRRDGTCTVEIYELAGM